MKKKKFRVTMGCVKTDIKIYEVEGIDIVDAWNQIMDGEHTPIEIKEADSYDETFLVDEEEI